jgi:hypothetical protein
MGMIRKKGRMPRDQQLRVQHRVVCEDSKHPFYGRKGTVRKLGQKITVEFDFGRGTQELERSVKLRIVGVEKKEDIPPPRGRAPYDMDE